MYSVIMLTTKLQLKWKGVGGEQRILLLISVKFASEIIFVVFEVTFVSVREGVGGGRRDESKNGVGGGVRI